jgi:sulfite reductase (NADPH) flavoprotein alpha-component
MTLSIWRYAHLTLALVSSVFLALAAISGIILAYDAVQEKIPNYRNEQFDSINLAQLIPQLKKNYAEITELEIDHNGFVTLHAMDNDGNDVEAIIDPTNGKILAKPLVKSAFIQWVTAFHRSMFLKETGRLIVGLVSFILILIALSGLVLIIQRQRTFRQFFGRVVKEYFTQYFHVVSGRLLLIPILILALTGTYLSLVRFNLLNTEVKTQQFAVQSNGETSVSPEKIELFQKITLPEVKKIEFPFSDEPEDYYTLKLKSCEIQVSQVNGQIVSEQKYPFTQVLDELSLDWHTGRSSIWLAVVLGLASLNILMFIYSGFAISLKRGRNPIKNNCTVTDAECVIWVGSEAGSTLQFATRVQEQLQTQGLKCYITELNNYQLFPSAKRMLFFASTYGLGDAPSNADKFLSLLSQIPQQQTVDCSVVGFGSTNYDDFCKFAQDVQEALTKQHWAEVVLPLYTVDDKSTEQFITWLKEWGRHTGVELSTTPAVYQGKPKDLQKMILVDRTELSDDEHSFKLTIHLPGSSRFTSGDLLAIYPNNDGRERLYSIAKCDGQIQLIVKLYPNGLGSGFLNDLKVGDSFQARIVSNPAFYYPKKKKVVMISNGTGIAPFLGMISQCNPSSENYLYAGFRNETPLVSHFQHCLLKYKNSQRLQSYQMAFSKEKNHCYVMDLIRSDADHIASLLNQGTIFMICGSLAMQKDVEQVLNEIALHKNSRTLQEYKACGQLLTDCY